MAGAVGSVALDAVDRGGGGQPGMRGWPGVIVFTALGVVVIVFAKSRWLRWMEALLPGVCADGMR